MMDFLAASRAKRVTEFWELVRRGAPDECWPWVGYVDSNGYGKFYFAGRMYGSHELAVTFTTGEVRSEGLDTCHGRSCVTRRCCNPAHVRFDTRLGNVADTCAGGRNFQPARKLTDEQVVEMRQRRAAGAAQQLLASAYGISESLVSQIVRGLRYVNAGGPVQTKREYFRVR